MKLLSMDPGTRGCGVALFNSIGRLHAATYLPNRMTVGRRLDSCITMAKDVFLWASQRGAGAESVACEVPRSYNAGNQKGPQDDLIDLAMVSAAVAGMFHYSKVLTYYPQEWKGSVKAETFLRRIISRLDEGEKAVIELVMARKALDDVPDSDSLDHNTLDAIGIGLHYLGRMAPVRQYARD